MKASATRVSPNAIEICDGISSVYIENKDLAAIAQDLRRLAEEQAERERTMPETVDEAIHDAVNYE